MSFITMSIPPYLDLVSALNCAKQLNSQPESVQFIALDFASWRTSRAHELPLKPFGMLIISQAVCQFKVRVPQATIVPMNLPDNEIESYAAHMGFFQACGVDLGKQPGEAKGSPTYLPITRKATSDLIHSRDAETLAEELAQKLAQQSGGMLVKTLSFSFLEIIRNVIEHSRSSDFWYCAQYWPSRGEAEIALIDSGIGLQASLSDNPHLRPHLLDDRTAIKYALLPGISGKMYPGKRSDPYDVWENTGFGLYMNYRICNEGGSFFIASGNTGLYREKDADNQYYDYVLPGVALRLRMRAETLENYEQKYHALFLRDGEREAKNIRGGVVPTSDKLSRMLRGGFTTTSSEGNQ